MTPKLIFHLLPSAHLDPVWLWDWREGFSEGLTTVTTVLDLMDEYPELTFIRGEVSIYRHIQKTAPRTFERILARISEGRWDAVGGTFVQPDSNLAATETLCRHFETGLRWFEKELGVRPRVAWQPDSFGHTAGWPDILSGFGMEAFAFSRPSRKVFPMPETAFRWRGPGGGSLLCYRQHWDGYGVERHNLGRVLDETLRAARAEGRRTVGVLIGLGNHGGGPTRRHLADARAWGAAHPEVEIRFSTLHRFFGELEKELARSRARIPEVEGEFGCCLRGCSSSLQKFKSLYRNTEAALASSEASAAVIHARLGGDPVPLDEAWEAILFNSFHDILPGTSIERAFEDQIAWTGLAAHHAHRARFAALNRLAARLDTRVPRPANPDAPADVPVLVWNPLPRPYSGPVEIEAPLDYRPLWDYENRADALPFALRDALGRLLPFQEIATEHSSLPTLPWRKRVVTHLKIPAFGWCIVRLGLAEKKIAPKPGRGACRASGKAAIANVAWRIGVSSRGGIAIQKDGAPFLRGLRALVVEDPWGSWGGMNEEPDSIRLDHVREEWTVAQSSVLESGPERARLWTRWQGRNSWLDLTFDLCRGIPWVTVQGRMLWNERSARLQLVIPSTGPALCDVPGGTAVRAERGQVHVGRWFRRANAAGVPVGVASDVLSDADFLPGETRLTLARASRYANDKPTDPEEQPWQPSVDCGELKFRLCLFSEDPDRAAESLLWPPVTLLVTPGAGDLPVAGSLGDLTPASMRLLSAQPDAEGLRVRVQNRGPKTMEAVFRLGEKAHSLGRLRPQQIVTRVLPSA